MNPDIAAWRAAQKEEARIDRQYRSLRSHGTVAEIARCREALTKAALATEALRRAAT